MLDAMSTALDVFADGSFDPATFSGGWAFVVLEEGRQVHAFSGSAEGASNNSLEVLAALRAMAWIEAEQAGRSVTLWTDSVHVIEGCRRWRTIWRGNGWKRINANPRARRRSIPDLLLWQELDALIERNPHVGIEWCRGHSGNAGNDHADMLARRALSA